MTAKTKLTKVLVERAGGAFHVYRNADRPGADVTPSCALTEEVVTYPGASPFHSDDEMDVGAAMGWFGDWCRKARLRPVFAD